MQNLQRGPVDPDPDNNLAEATVIQAVDTDHGPAVKYGVLEDAIAMSAIESAVSIRDVAAKRCGDI